MDRPNIKLLALDLDGTLTNSKKEISEENKRALWEAIEKGVFLALASGRPALGIRHLAQELKLYEKGGFIMAYNGGEIMDCRTGEIIFRRTVPMRLVPEICALGRELKLHMVSYDDPYVLSEDPDGGYVKNELFCCRAEAKKVERLEDALSEEPVKFIAADDPEVLKKAFPIFKERFGEALNLFFSEPYFMELTPKGIEKGYGVSKIAEYLSITSKEVMAVGDSYNDLPMLKWAGLSVAMGNAVPEVREIADVQTLSNNEDGVAAAVRTYIFEA